MIYASLDFTYTGPYQNIPGEPPNAADRALMVADAAVHAAAQERGVEMAHEYLWPDGTLYKMIRVQDGQDVTQEAILLQRRADAIARTNGGGVSHVHVIVNVTGVYHAAGGDEPIEAWFNRRLMSKRYAKS